MQYQFIPIATIVNNEVQPIFINVTLIQSITQSDSDIRIEMTNQQIYIIPDTNLQVFMDRFKQ